LKKSEQCRWRPGKRTIHNTHRIGQKSISYRFRTSDTRL